MDQAVVLGRLETLPIYQAFQKSPYLSMKHVSYFWSYETIFGPYRGRAVTFVEIGVLNGGSLFMWREYFGPQARIIGIDLNPLAKRWEADGFEIYIGDQSDPAFWRGFFEAVGDVDVLLDDGGHTNEQQIVTTVNCLPHVRDGGVLVVEDTHTSYFREMGNPSRVSFIAWAKRLVDAVNARFPQVAPHAEAAKDIVSSVRFFESIVVFEVDRAACFTNFHIMNSGRSLDAENMWKKGTLIENSKGLSERVGQRLAFLRRIKWLKAFLLWTNEIILRESSYWYFWGKNRKLKRYFQGK